MIETGLRSLLSPLYHFDEPVAASLHGSFIHASDYEGISVASILKMTKAFLLHERLLQPRSQLPLLRLLAVVKVGIHHDEYYNL